MPSGATGCRGCEGHVGQVSCGAKIKVLEPAQCLASLQPQHVGEGCDVSELLHVVYSQVTPCIGRETVAD